MGNFDNYYIDGNGNAHRDIPLGTSPADAYVRTNLKMKNEIKKIEDQIETLQQELDGVYDLAQKRISDLFENVSQNIAGYESELTVGNNAFRNGISSDLSAISQRINGISAQSGNDITEIVDARTASSDGETKNCLSARLNADYSSLHSELSDISDELAIMSSDTEGNTYLHAGECISQQFSNLNDKSNCMADFNYYPQLIDISTIFHGYAIDNTSGADINDVLQNEYADCTTGIKTRSSWNNKTIKMNFNPTGIHFYDFAGARVGYQPVSSVVDNGDGTFEVTLSNFGTNDIQYIRFQYSNINYSSDNVIAAIKENWSDNIDPQLSGCHPTLRLQVKTQNIENNSVTHDKLNAALAQKIDRSFNCASNVIEGGEETYPQLIDYTQIVHGYALSGINQADINDMTENMYVNVLPAICFADSVNDVTLKMNFKPSGIQLYNSEQKRVSFQPVSSIVDNGNGTFEVTINNCGGYMISYVRMQYSNVSYPADDRIITVKSQWSDSIDYRKYGTIPYHVRHSAIENESIAEEKLAPSVLKKIFHPQNSDKAIVTLIDDDGYSDFSRIKQILDSAGLKCTLAVVQDYIGTSHRLSLSEIINLKENGFDIVSHSKSHSASVFGGSAGNVNLAAVSDDDLYQDLRGSFEYLRNHGIPTDTIVYPWGNFPQNYNAATNNPDPSDDSLTGAENQKMRYCRLAKKAGYRFGVNAGGTPTNSGSVLDNMYLGRVFLSNSRGFDYYKNLIDECVTNKGWLILGTHSQDTSNIPDELIQNVIDYIVASDAEFMTFSQAKQIKQNLVSIGEYEDTSNNFFVGRDGTIMNN